MARLPKLGREPKSMRMSLSRKPTMLCRALTTYLTLILLFALPAHAQARRAPPPSTRLPTQLTKTIPAQGAIGVALGRTTVLTFSRSLDLGTVTAQSIYAAVDGVPIQSSVL